MKKVMFFAVIFCMTLLMSCKKVSNLPNYLPTIQGTYMVPDSTTDPVIIITDGSKVCEMHTLPHGRYVKLISGFPKEYLCKEMMEEQLFQYYFYERKDSILQHHTFFYQDQWENWFNNCKILGYTYPKTGVFLLFKDNTTGKFFLNGVAFTTWYSSDSYSFYNAKGGFLPSGGGLTGDVLEQGSVFLPVIYFQEKFW